MGMEHVQNEIFKTVTANFFPECLNFSVDLNLHFFQGQQKFPPIPEAVVAVPKNGGPRAAQKAVSGGGSACLFLSLFFTRTNQFHSFSYFISQN